MPSPDPLKRRLLARIADADRSHLDVDPAAGLWQRLRPGVQLLPLAEADGRLSYLLRFEPGASLPPHRHPADEECVVLAGRLCIGSHTEVGANAYHRAHAGSLHPMIVAPEGALVFLRGAVPRAEDLL
jgi:anti-sigma factor ChrR (cupin superfamily)